MDTTTPGMRVLMARTSRRLKQEDLAEQLGMNRPRLSAIENDQVTNPRASEIEAMERVLLIPASVWLDAARAEKEAAP